MNRRLLTLLILLMLPAIALTAGCKKKFEIRDVDPSRAGEVRSLGPESQDVLAISDEMSRSLLASPAFKDSSKSPTIVMLPMVNNTRHAFNQEIFSSLLKVELNKSSNGRLKFVARDISEDVLKEREMKREGDVDYDPDLRARVPAGADYFLKGRADGLAAVSTKGQSDTIGYTFKLIDSETMIEVWEDMFITKKEGKDDVIYR